MERRSPATSPSRDLAARARDPGFTPSARDLAPLVELLVDEAVAMDAERAIARAGRAAAGVLEARLGSAEPRLRARIVRALGRVAGRVPSGRAQVLLIGALEDADPKTRRNAAIALGRGMGDTPPDGNGAGDPTTREGDAGDAPMARRVEEALLAAWTRDPRVEMRRSLAASLGKVGSVRALPCLAEAARSGDRELERIAARSAAMIERTSTRAARGSIDGRPTLASPIDVVAVSRRGLEGLLAEELSAIGALTDVRVTAAGRVEARLQGPLEVLFGARTMLSFRFPQPTVTLGRGEDLAAAVARAATTDSARAALATWTRGAVRYRVAWAEGGHKRATTWQIARLVAERAPELVNDPTCSTWELVVDGDHSVQVAWAPRSLEDPRFAWRRRQVPAASHPTVAAALARIAGVQDDDIVWDPFVGSGGELAERARLGPLRALLGSDIEPRALDAARENLAAAGVAARLECADACAFAPSGVTLILTNPPMGRRAARTGGLGDLLDQFIEHAAELLVAGGRLVWIAPWPDRARAAAARAGLHLEWSRRVDMGGFDAELQRWRKPSGPTPAPRPHEPPPRR